MKLLSLISLSLLALGPNLIAQEFEAPVAGPSNGYINAPSPFVPTGRELLNGLQIGLGTSFVYDSNIFQAPDTLAAPAESDMILSVSPSIAYRTQGARWVLGANAGLDYRSYFSNTDLSGLGYDGGVNFAYSGRPLTVQGAFTYSLSQGSNRFYGNPGTKTHNFGTSLSASFRFSAKTSLDARYSYRWSERDQTAFGANSTTSFDISALWKATPLTTIGPGVAWSFNSGDRLGGRQTVGPIIRLKYKLAKKVALDGTFGMDFVEYDNGGSGDPTFSTRLGVNYRASSLWGMNLSIFKGTSSDGSVAGAYRDTTSFRLGYNRRIRRASLGLGVSYDMDDYTRSTGIAVGGNRSRDYFSFDTSLGMAVFRNRANVSTFASWRQETGGGRGDWDGFQTGFSVSSKF